jgi:hypothetical protein
MPQYVVHYDGRDYSHPNWASALKEARTIVDKAATEPDCTSIISVLRHNSEEECKTSGIVPIYRVIKKAGIQPVFVVYAS